MESQVAAEIAKHREAVVAHPTDSKRLAELAMVFHAHGLEKPATTLYQQLSNLDPTDYRWPYLHASIESGNDLEQAKALFLQASALSPTNSGFYVQLGDLHYRRAEHAEAAASYDKAIQLNPTQAYALLGMAKIAVDKNRPKLALEHLEQAIKLSPHFGQAHRLAARVYHRLGDSELAQDATQKADTYWLRTKPDDPVMSGIQARAVSADAYTLRGMREMNRGQLELAKRHFTKALEFAPSVNSRLNLGDVFIKMGATDAALEQQLLALKLEPKHVLGNLQTGLSYARKNQLKLALQHLRVSLEQAPEDPQVVVSLSETLIKAGEHGQAIELLEQKQHLNSGKVKALFAWELATAPLSEQRHGEKALAIAQSLLQQAPTDPVVMDLVAVAYAELGDFPLAIRMGKAALAEADNRNRPDLSSVFNKRLALYARKQPYHHR